MKFASLKNLARFANRVKLRLNQKADDNQVVKLSGDQTINGRKRLKRPFLEADAEIVTDSEVNNGLLILHVLNNKQIQHASRFIGFYINKTRTGFLGYASSNNSDFSLVNSTGGFTADVRGKLTLKTNGDIEVKSASGSIVISQNGLKITTNSDLQLEVNGAVKLLNNRQIKNVQNPTERSDASTKAYVDDLTDQQKQAIKAIVARSTDFNQFKQEVARW